MRLATLAVMFVACASRRTPIERTVETPKAVVVGHDAEPATDLVRELRRGVTRNVFHPRFEFSVEGLVPEPSDELRWPLSANSHPSFEPGYAIAAALAQPGVTWVDLCNRGAHKRRLSAQQDRIAYLAAWCHALAHDVDAAIAGLAPLQRSMTHGIVRTIHVDIANVLVAEMEAPQALRVLAKHQLSSPELFDVLAATYAELGKRDDAREINLRALESNAYATSDTKCHRLAREAVLGDPDVLKKLEALAREPNAECERLHTILRCWQYPGRECATYLTERGVSERPLFLLEAYLAWPKKPAAPDVWLQLAGTVRDAIPFEDADMIAMAAIETALRGTACDSPALRPVQDAARSLLATRGVKSDIDARITAVLTKPETLCWKR